MIEILDNQHASTFTEHQAVPTAIERSACLLGSIVALRQLLEQALPHQAERVDLAFGTADQEEVGVVAAEDAEGLAQREQAGDVALGDGVVRSLGVVQDRDVAGQHVRQIFQHPQRLNDRNARGTPLLQVDLAGLAVDTGTGGVGQFGQFGGDQAGPEFDAEASRVEFGSCRPCRR